MWISIVSAGYQIIFKSYISTSAHQKKNPWPFPKCLQQLARIPNCSGSCRGRTRNERKGKWVSRWAKASPYYFRLYVVVWQFLDWASSKPWWKNYFQSELSWKQNGKSLHSLTHLPSGHEYRIIHNNNHSSFRGICVFTVGVMINLVPLRDFLEIQQKQKISYS